MPVELVPVPLQMIIIGGAIAAALTAIYRASRAIGPIVRRIQAVHVIIERELQPNNGSSMRDQVCRTAEEMDRVTTRLGAINGDLQHYVAESDRAHSDLWEALADLGYDRRGSGPGSSV